jgi:hypothetical protein
MTATLVAALLIIGTLHAALPEPRVEMRFSEGAGAATANAGALAGSATLTQANDYPAFAPLVPFGPFAPANNHQSADFGTIAAGQGGRAIDLVTDLGDGGTLGTFPSGFTICGWLNARNLSEGWGGNRIAFALESPNGAGFDLVQLANGALRIGINQWPDGANGGGPSSSTGRLKADPQAGVSNWVYFAVTYDPALPSGNVKFYFGSPTKLAAFDVARNYKGGIANEGLVEYTGTLTVGNFSAVVGARTELGPSGGSRVFRGLMDEIKIYDRALELAEVQQAQMNGALPPVAASISQSPTSLRVFAGQPATFAVQVEGTAPFAFQWQRNGVDIPGATGESYTMEASSLADDGAQYRVKVSNALANDLASEPARLTVLPENGHKISLSFSDGGSSVTNQGNLQGSGSYAIAQGFPLSSTKVPAGAFAPADNIASVDFGGIAAGQGGRAIDLTNSFDNTLGPLAAFTVTGWLNCQDVDAGWGGNRIAFALNAPNGAGFDLVQLANGALRIGVNEWPDASPGGPASTEGKITADPETGAGNWVFFAVTYDSTLPAGHLRFFFGTPTQTAQLDYAADYDRGVVARTGPLTLGNFSTVVSARNESGPGGGSRCFRGLMDEINVFNQALSLAEIQARQKAPAYRPVTAEPVALVEQPQSLTLFAGQIATFRVNASGSLPMTYQWWRKHAGAESAIPGATNAAYNLPQVTVADSGDQFWAVVANPQGPATTQRATLTVLEETYHKVFLSFSEGSGASTANLGDLGGSGQFVQRDDFPMFSPNVPIGPLAPASNQTSIDFGAIDEGQGGRAVDFSNAFGNTLGTLNAFTLTGWLNCRDLRVGWGGNRILFALAAPNGAGFDLVQLADGALQLGVNQWPDGSPARSSGGWIPEDATTSAANWVFFAVTYDGTVDYENAQFFFGTPTQAAQLDFWSVDYNRGVVQPSGALTLGNFGTVVTARDETGPSGGSRVFRGLMDEINVFSRVLTLGEIQAVQKAPAQIPIVAAPELKAVLQGQDLVVSWESTAILQLQSRANLSQGSWADVSTAPIIEGNLRTVRLPATAPAQFYRLLGR